MIEYNSQDIFNIKGPILITGASGFIGANLFINLLNYRTDVFAIVRTKDNWRLKNVKSDNIITSDLNNYKQTELIIKTIKPKTIYNCAAFGAYSFENDINKIYQINFIASINLLELAVKEGLEAFINAGSSSEYGINCSEPEVDTIRIPNSHYAVSKSALSDYIKYCGKFRSIPCLNLRLYSVYGKYEDTSRLIPTVLKCANLLEYPDFVAPNITRDFIHINDVCNAFIKASININPAIYGNSINIGTGKSTSIFELAYLVKEKFNIKDDPQFGSYRSRDWDLINWYANISDSKSLINWNPLISFQDGLSITNEWIKGLDPKEFNIFTKNIKTNQQNFSISAIVACYKDEEAINEMYLRLSNIFHKLKIDYEIIFVNDCSPDKTEGIIKELSSTDSNVKGISHSRNFGSQMAFRSGMEISTMDAVVLLDGDLQDPPEIIENFYLKFKEGFDVVYGCRIKREMNFFNELFYKIFYRIFSFFSYLNIPLDAGDFSLMSKRVVKSILESPERDLFLRGLRAYVGYKQVGVNYFRPKRPYGISTNNIFKNIEWAKKGIFSFSDTPLTILTFAGLILMIITFIIIFIIASMRLFYPDIAPRGSTTILISILFFGSINLFAIGIVGEYISKIIIEVKGRPRYIKRAIIQNGTVTEINS